ncbi:MAG: carbohydrate ABC transporter permease [Butyribacter sp.]|nr:carbohydrate ABC transporter permease [bacterium]MDY3853873.1 carbohydrate ABC transporter permease [Butyribacter sp.]
MENAEEKVLKPKKRTSLWSLLGTVFFTFVSVAFLAPIFIVLINSFKGKAFINLETFKLPTEQSFVGLQNYTEAITQYDFIKAVGWTVFITVFSVAVILICCSMTAWYITRVQNKLTKFIYLLCVFSMVIPFQMVMFTLSGTADSLHLNTPWGIIIVYLGFGAGLAVFMFCGFVKAIPVEIEEAATIDGCSPISTFFRVVLPMLKPTYISVGILEAMWIWNDFLLPYLVLDIKKYKTISIVIQYMKGSYGRVDMGAIMACLIMAIIPVVVFYLSAQKYIIKGVADGAVKG